MKQIINSILDTDLYKLTMQWFVICNYPEAEGQSAFSNRDISKKFTPAAVEEIKRQVLLMANLKLTDEEYDWMRDELPFLPVAYRQYLAAYRFNPSQVFMTLNKDGELSISIKGKWRDKILWEVPLMAIISEVYFDMVDTDWSMYKQDYRANLKARLLSQEGCMFADFGTRRRRNFETQDIVVREMKNYTGFAGTSNPYLAMKHGVKALGTCAHEAIGAVAALDSLNHPNACFMDRWSDTYGGALGTMLPDTFGTASCLRDFNLKRAKLWDGLRHDSDDPFKFVDIVVAHYKKLGIDPMTKTIIFSDNLNVTTAIELANYCKGKIRCSFGIGTFFTSDFMKVSKPEEKSTPMNMVIKLVMINGIPVCKLSDNPSKSIGDPYMIEIMRYIHFSQYQHD